MGPTPFWVNVPNLQDRVTDEVLISETRQIPPTIASNWHNISSVGLTIGLNKAELDVP